MISLTLHHVLDNPPCQSVISTISSNVRKNLSGKGKGHKESLAIVSAIIGPLFNKYLGKVQVKDGIKQKTGRRKAGASDTLTFSGLFSAIDATFLATSVQDLRLDP